MEFAKGISPSKPFRQVKEEIDFKVWLANKMYKKWIEKNRPKIIEEIKEMMIKEKYIMIDEKIDDEIINYWLDNSKITKK